MAGRYKTLISAPVLLGFLIGAEGNVAQASSFSVELTQHNDAGQALSEALLPTGFSAALGYISSSLGNVMGEGSGQLGARFSYLPGEKNPSKLGYQTSQIQLEAFYEHTYPSGMEAKPYVGLGIGIIESRDESDAEVNKGLFQTYQITSGLSFYSPQFPEASLTVGYRQSQTAGGGNPEALKDEDINNIQDQTFEGKVNIRF